MLNRYFSFLKIFLILSYNKRKRENSGGIAVVVPDKQGPDFQSRLSPQLGFCSVLLLFCWEQSWGACWKNLLPVKQISITILSVLIWIQKNCQNLPLLLYFQKLSDFSFYQNYKFDSYEKLGERKHVSLFMEIKHLSHVLIIFYIKCFMRFLRLLKSCQCNLGVNLLTTEHLLVTFPGI